MADLARGPISSQISRQNMDAGWPSAWGCLPPHDALRRHKFAYRLTTADNGEDMLNMIARLDRDPAEGCPDLFLIDLNLPRRSGDEILARLRQSSRCSQIPAIVITSSDSSQDRARARDLGASYYFRKPADLEKQTHGVPSL